MKIAASPTNTEETVTGSAAWQEFVDLYSPMVLAWCRQFGLQDADASDALQEVLVKLLRVMKDFEYDPSRGNFRSWLKTVTSNLVRDLQRAAKPGDSGSGESRIQQYLCQIKDPQAFDQLSQLFQRQYEEELIALAGQRVQQRVEKKNWQAYCLYAVQQQKANAVAEQLQMPVAEVYVAKSRITKLMREEIAKLE